MLRTDSPLYYLKSFGQVSLLGVCLSWLNNFVVIVGVRFTTVHL